MLVDVRERRVRQKGHRWASRHRWTREVESVETAPYWGTCVRWKGPYDEMDEDDFHLVS